jgi:hypothetical protein
MAACKHGPLQQYIGMAWLRARMVKCSGYLILLGLRNTAPIPSDTGLAAFLVRLDSRKFQRFLAKRHLEPVRDLIKACGDISIELHILASLSGSSVRAQPSLHRSVALLRVILPSRRTRDTWRRSVRRHPDTVEFWLINEPWLYPPTTPFLPGTVLLKRGVLLYSAGPAFFRAEIAKLSERAPCLAQALCRRSKCSAASVVHTILILPGTEVVLLQFERRQTNRCCLPVLRALAARLNDRIATQILKNRLP